jgi:hypothetical protein
MDFIESSLYRLKENVRRFMVPSTALWDVPVLKAQIELRQRALTDMEIIRFRLRPLMNCEGPRQYRTSRKQRSARSRIASARRRYS